MPALSPTRDLAFGFRITHGDREEWFRFQTLDRLSTALARRVHPPGHHSQVSSVTFTTMGDSLSLLTRQTKSSAHPRWGSVSIVTHTASLLEVFGPTGRVLNAHGILLKGEALTAKKTRLFRWGQMRDYRGYGPVPGIRKWRGGNGYCRRMRTTSEQRLNALTLLEEGEISARAARSGRNLANSWDDHCRHRQEGWKAQHKGCKSWAHPPRHGAPSLFE